MSHHNVFLTSGVHIWSCFVFRKWISYVYHTYTCTCLDEICMCVRTLSMLYVHLIWSLTFSLPVIYAVSLCFYFCHSKAKSLDRQVPNRYYEFCLCAYVSNYWNHDSFCWFVCSVFTVALDNNKSRSLIKECLLWRIFSDVCVHVWAYVCVSLYENNLMHKQQQKTVTSWYLIIHVHVD